MTDPVRRARLGAAARALVEANRGAKDKTLEVLDALLPPARSAYPSNVRPFRAREPGGCRRNQLCWTFSTRGRAARRAGTSAARGPPSSRSGRSSASAT